MNDTPPQRDAHHSEAVGIGDSEAGDAATGAGRPMPARDDSARAVLVRLGPAAILGVLWAILPALGGIAVLYFIADISAFLREHQLAGFALYVVVFIFSAGFGLLPTYSQSLLAGYAFGLAQGFAGALAGFTGAALVGHVIARTVARERMEREISAHPKAAIVRDALVGRGFWPSLGITTLVRLPPNSPFALTNLILTGAGVSKRVYVLSTMLGLAPRSLAAVYIGTQISDWSNRDTPIWMLVMSIVLTVAAILIIGNVAQRALHRFASRGG